MTSKERLEGDHFTVLKVWWKAWIKQSGCEGLIHEPCVTLKQNLFLCEEEEYFLTRQLRPAGCGCYVGNSRWGCFQAWCLPGCNYQSSRAWHRARRPRDSCEKPPPSLQHRGGAVRDRFPTHRGTEARAASVEFLHHYSYNMICIAHLFPAGIIRRSVWKMINYR